MLEKQVTCTMPTRLDSTRLDFMALLHVILFSNMDPSPAKQCDASCMRSVTASLLQGFGVDVLPLQSLQQVVFDLFLSIFLSVDQYLKCRDSVVVNQIITLYRSTIHLVDEDQQE